MKEFILGFLLFSTSLLLILIVLVQRGRGGGLTGALGGPGGQSAFGSKAGDLFTKITVWVAGFWIVLCVASILLLSGSSGQFTGGTGNTAPPDAATGTGDGTGTDGTGAGETTTTPAEETSN